MAFGLGWMAKGLAALDGRTVSVAVRVSDPDRAFGLTLDEAATLGETPAAPDATLTAPAEAWLRLVSGRLAPRYTAPGTRRRRWR